MAFPDENFSWAPHSLWGSTGLWVLVLGIFRLWWWFPCFLTFPFAFLASSWWFVARWALLWESKVQRLGRGCEVQLHGVGCQDSGSLPPESGSSLAFCIACQSVTALIMNFPATWYPCVFTPGICLYTCAALLCNACTALPVICWSPCLLLLHPLHEDLSALEMLMNTPSPYWGEISNHCSTAQHKWVDLPQVRQESCNRSGTKAWFCPIALPLCAALILLPKPGSKKVSSNQPALCQNLSVHLASLAASPLALSSSSIEIQVLVWGEGACMWPSNTPSPWGKFTRYAFGDTVSFAGLFLTFG